MRNLKVFFVVSLTMAILLCQGSVSLAEDDIRMFNFFQLKHKVNDKFDVFIQPDLKSRDDIGELYYYHIRCGGVLHASKNLDLGATYRFLENKNSADKWLDENRLEMDLAPKVEVNGFKLLNRGRLEYRGIEQTRDRWRYRNLIKVAYPAKILDAKVIPYITEEVFYDFEIDKMHLNWATVGVDRKLTKDFLLGLFYRNEATRVSTKDEWDTNHIIGTKAVRSF